MLDVKILQIYGILLGKSLKDTLEQLPMLIPVHPVFVSVWLNLFEFEA